MIETAKIKGTGFSPTPMRVFSMEGAQRIGPYKLKDTLGIGNNGTVFLAQQDTKGTSDIALKVFHRLTEGSDPSIEITNHKLLCELGLPNILPYVDDGHGQINNKSHTRRFQYLATEYAEGGTLSEHSILPVGQALDLTKQAAVGIDSIHDAGFIHRDINPRNLLLTTSLPETSNLWIGDFESLEKYDGWVKTDRVILAPGYTAPENMLGFISPYGDQFSLAAVFVGMVGGSIFPAPNPDFYKSVVFDRDYDDIMHDGVDELVPAPLRSPVRKALSWAPTRRYANTLEFVTDLQSRYDESIADSHRPPQTVII